MSNIAFIDGQNLHLGTAEAGLKIDYKKFRIYLKEKYDICEAYYFLGYLDEDQQDLYTALQKAGFILKFREHIAFQSGKKKGNVDTDIVFEVMRHQIESSNLLCKIVLVSGDGDYKKMVDYLISKRVFLKILFPNAKFASSLYQKLGGDKFDFLDRVDMRKRIAYLK